MNIKDIFKGIYQRRGQREVTIQEIKDIMKKLDNVVLMDVRSSQEYTEGHLPDSINLPLYEIEKYVLDIIPDLGTVIILYCQSGRRSKQAIELLEKKGYTNLYNLINGLDGM